jgi:Domain of unknown function (DUF6647)
MPARAGGFHGVTLDHSALASLIVELFTAISFVSAYPAPAVLPEVHPVPQSEIQRRLCDSRPCRIKAFYHPDWGIFIDDTLDIHNDPFDRSILLHELVHHLQKTTGKFEVLASFCSQRISEELEAYEIQNRYLSTVHSSRRALVLGWTGRCTDAEQAFTP